MTGYGAKSQTSKNLAWWLPRPSRYKYPGGMPLYCEKWLIDLAINILHLQRHPKILNVFCGGCKYGFRVDLNPEVKPDLLWDIHKLTEKVSEMYDIILADPPYSNTEVKEIYEACDYIDVKYPKLNYKIWARECHKLLKPGGLFIIYHKRFMPPPDKNDYLTVRRVFIGGIPNHTPRIAIYYKRKVRKKTLFD